MDKEREARREAAKLLHLPTKTVRSLLRRNELSVFKARRQWLILLRDVIKMRQVLKRQRVILASLNQQATHNSSNSPRNSAMPGTRYEPN